MTSHPFRARAAFVAALTVVAATSIAGPPAVLAQPVAAEPLVSDRAPREPADADRPVAEPLIDSRGVAEPLEGLLARAEDWRALPQSKPSLRAGIARSCTPADAELEWARLPRALRDVPLEAMAGQLLVVSFSGERAGDAGVVAARDAIAASRIGGVLFFRHNVGSADDVRAVNALFADARPFASTSHGLPPIVSVDQEGGAVMRLRASEGAPRTPSARDLAAAGLPAARAAYEEMARALAGLGFNTNFGPVVDLEVNPDNPVVAAFGRSYGADPSRVGAFATAFVEAHRAAGIATAAKHFPGHGSSTNDSHEGAIDLGPTFRRAELVPFRDLVATGAADMVMVGHLMLPGVTGADGLPASISPGAIDGVLRKDLCFGGIVISDDLAMDAISRTWDAPTAVKLMVEAGGDIALLSFSGDSRAGIDAVLAAVTEEARRSEAFATRLRHAYARIVHHKLDMAGHNPRAITVADAD